MKRNNLLIVGVALIIVAIFLALFMGKCGADIGTKSKAEERSHWIKEPLVLSFHKIAEKAGLEIMNSGGNAFDAYVAVTLVENVVSSGYVTMAGLLSTLIYHSETRKVLYMDGGFNSVIDPRGNFDPKNPVEGKKIVVPGLVAGLFDISKRYGRMSFSRVLEPAIKIAREGFVIDELYSHYVRAAAKKLQRTKYGRMTFFPSGKALQPGDILKQPELAEFLTELEEKGSTYMYKGGWASKMVDMVQKLGGFMTLKDLASYQPSWSEPWKISYRDYHIFGSSGHSLYALWALLALKTLEHTSIAQLGHYSVSADALEIMVRIARAIDKEYWIHDYKNLNNHTKVNSRLSNAYTVEIWNKIKEPLEENQKKKPPENHTLCTVIADLEGNVVCGKHSINSDLWGLGIFVQGVLINGSGDMLGRFTGQGKRRTQGAPNFLVFKDNRLKYALGTFSFSNPHAAFQLLVNLMDYGIPADQAVELPRFGSYPLDEKNWSVDLSRNWLDERVSQNVVNILKNRGLLFSQKSTKLGKGGIVEFHSDGTATTGYDKTN